MKKLKTYVIIALLAMSLNPSYSIAKTSDVLSTSTSSNADEKAAAMNLLGRLKVIIELDKSELNSSQKQSLRKEVRSIRNELKLLSGGIYLSVGAIIIIILLLILLL